MVIDRTCADEMTMKMVVASKMRALSQWADNPSKGFITWGINTPAQTNVGASGSGNSAAGAKKEKTDRSGFIAGFSRLLTHCQACATMLASSTSRGRLESRLCPPTRSSYRTCTCA